MINLIYMSYICRYSYIYIGISAQNSWNHIIYKSSGLTADSPPSIVHILFAEIDAKTSGPVASVDDLR